MNTVRFTVPAEHVAEFRRAATSEVMANARVLETITSAYCNDDYETVAGPAEPIGLIDELNEVLRTVGWVGRGPDVDVEVEMRDYLAQMILSKLKGWAKDGLGGAVESLEADHPRMGRYSWVLRRLEDLREEVSV